MSAVDRARLHHRLSALYDDFDAVIVDAGPGLESVVRVATMRATRCVILAAPEPAALTDAYATIKIVNLQVADMRVDVLVNRVTDPQEGSQTFERLATAVSASCTAASAIWARCGRTTRSGGQCVCPGNWSRDCPRAPTMTC